MKTVRMAVLVVLCLLPRTGLWADEIACDETVIAPLPDFPAAGPRWARAKEIWPAVAKGWDPDSPVANATLLYGFPFEAQDYMRLAFAEEDMVAVDAVLDHMLRLMGRFRTVDRLLHYFPDGRTRLAEVVLSRPYPVLLAPDGYEDKLAASQFLGMTAEAVRLIARLPKAQRTPLQERFAAVGATLVAENLLRWSVERPGSWTQRGNGCRGFGETLDDYLRIAIERGTRPDEPLMCRGLTGIELWAVFAAVELLAAIRNSPALAAELPGGAVEVLEMVASRGATFTAQRLQVTDVRDHEGQRRAGMVIQPGAYAFHSDHTHAGYSGATFPTAGDAATISGLSMDFSHAMRLVPLLYALADDHADPAVRESFTVWRARFANQIAFVVFDGTLEQPRFRNYIDGTNGWYRVAYHGSTFGYPPYGMSASWLHGPFARLAEFQPRLRDIGAAVWQGAQAKDGPRCRHFQSTFGQSYWQGGSRPKNNVVGQDVVPGTLSSYVTMPARR